jgi:CvfB-like winged helix domain
MRSERALSYGVLLVASSSSFPFLSWCRCWSHAFTTLPKHPQRSQASFQNIHWSTSSSSSSSSSFSSSTTKPFQFGDPIQVEVTSFGPLGASVEVVARGHNPDDLIPVSQPPLGYGLVSQKEISYFRQGRNNVDVVRGEILAGYIEFIREDSKLSVGLRKPGGKAKAEDVSKVIMQKLGASIDGTLDVGDKSTPGQIARVFPGVSKLAFKKAVAALYKQRKIKPGPDSILLVAPLEENSKAKQ